MRRKIPSTSALLCFEAAARCESFAEAARDLNMSQSALGRQIQALEAQCGQSLFHRIRQRVKLTDAGRVLLLELEPLLEALEASFLRLSSHDNPDGAINIGTYPTLGSRWLMPKLSFLAQQHPKLTVSTLTYLDNSQLDAGLVDLAIVQGDPPWPGFRIDPLMRETLVAVCAPSTKELPTKNPEALLSHRILQHRSRILSWKIWLEAQGVALPRAPTGPLFSQFEMLIDAVKFGHGIAIVPEVLIAPELDQGHLILAHPFKAMPPSAYYLLTPQAKVGTRRIERLRDWLLQQESDAKAPT
ncbi:glycine cleavage system transcriptional activator [Roseobacter sp. SK209-2-6]|uniref:LysR substrate-binding domain-containing protein n=1 Tax=Roseobacter sp. SK209-2-6 TaxID=388739 RepID=UPI0000F3CE24|nr:LysR substrate-binding domain-containing protein [Roseobacter sp. SK209-2-6]EBA15921.1 glycine cleavage system transcriptional activator [Roseobacter sp. SK209-2-6]